MSVMENKSCSTESCSCISSGCGCNQYEAAPTATQELEENYRRINWWLEHSRKQTAKLWQILSSRIDQETQTEILEELGRNCASSLCWAEQYKGNPDGFFKFMNGHAGETFDYDRESGIITVTTRERDCDCRLVDSANISPVYCACSLGWQKHTYETILDRKVDVHIKESILYGNKRCVFEVVILED